MTITPNPPADNVSNVAQVEGMFTLRLLINSFETHQRLMVKAGMCEESTLRWYTDQFKHLRSLLDFPADSLRTHHLGAIDFTNAFVRALKRLYKWGASEELIPKDPFAKLTIPPCGKRERILKRAELVRLYLVASRPFRRLLYIQLHTLARPGEIRQLTWGQIDFEQRLILLTKFKAQKKRKDQKKVRPIPLSKPVLRMLRNLYRKSPDKSPDGRVFRSPRYGKPWSYNGARCAMRVAREKAGLNGGGERIVCYSLRHTGATEAIRANLNIKVVAEMMGHTRTTTTERYLHLDAGDLVQACDQVFTRPRRAERPGRGPDGSSPSSSA